MFKARRYDFTDQYDPGPAPTSVWVTRSCITGLIAGIGAVAFMMGYLPVG